MRKLIGLLSLSGVTASSRGLATHSPFFYKPVFVL